MVVLSNELRNLLTNESINSIMNAGSVANGHLVPDREEPSFSDSVQMDEEEILIVDSPVSREKEANMINVEEQIKKVICKYDKQLGLMTEKVNDLIKGFNVVEQKLKTLEQRPIIQQEQKIVSEEKKIEQNSNSTRQVKEKSQSNPRSVASLPPELSIENIFNCNGKKF